jgi:hypothetical protein
MVRMSNGLSNGFLYTYLLLCLCKLMTLRWLSVGLWFISAAETFIMSSQLLPTVFQTSTMWCAYGSGLLVVGEDEEPWLRRSFSRLFDSDFTIYSVFISFHHINPIDSKTKLLMRDSRNTLSSEVTPHINHTTTLPLSSRYQPTYNLQNQRTPRYLSNNMPFAHLFSTHIFGKAVQARFPPPKWGFALAIS